MTKEFCDLCVKEMERHHLTELKMKSRKWESRTDDFVKEVCEGCAQKVKDIFNVAT
jgi:hypothetical protein